MTARPVTRYALVAAIVLAIGGIFVYREFLAPGQVESLGVAVDAPRPELGRVAPDFVLEPVGGGETVRLSDFLGQPVVLNFWATWCFPCREEMPDLQRAHDEEGVVVLTVNAGESDVVVTEFLEELGLTMPAVVDRDGSVGQHYGVLGLPTTFFIDATGVLRARNFGPVYEPLLTDGINALR